MLQRLAAAALAVWLVTTPPAGRKRLHSVSACFVPLPDCEGEASRQPGLVASLEGWEATADWASQPLKLETAAQRQWVFAGDFMQSVGAGFDRASGRCYSVEWAAAATQRLQQATASVQQLLGLQVPSIHELLAAMRLPPAQQWGRSRAVARARAVAAIVLQHYWAYWQEDGGSWQAADRGQLLAAVEAGA